MGKTFVGKITKEQQYRVARKANREIELEANGGWTAKHRVHKSLKAYSRKTKHKTLY